MNKEPSSRRKPRSNCLQLTETKVEIPGLRRNDALWGGDSIYTQITLTHHLGAEAVADVGNGLRFCHAHLFHTAHMLAGSA